MDEAWAFILIMLIYIIFAIDGVTTDKHIHALEKDNHQKADSLMYMSKQIDSLRIHMAKLEHVTNERYLEQVRVDSIQDSYSQMLNIRTAPLLGGAE